MKVLITGATGLVGRAVARELLARGHAVHALVRDTQKPAPHGCGTVCADLSNEQEAIRALRGTSWDAVVHAAAAIPGVTNVAPDFAVNVAMTRNLSAAISSMPPKQLVFTSTLDVYAASDAALITESSRIEPGTAYAVSKRVCEEWVEGWCRSARVNACILRLTHIFGPGDRGRKFIPSAIRAIRAGQPVVIHGDGGDLRDYMYADDMAQAVALALEKRVSGVLNVATGTSVSLRDVLDALKRAAGFDFPVEYQPRKKPRVDYRFDVSQLRAAIGVPRLTPLPDALKRTYEADL